MTSEDNSKDWALYDRDAKALIGTMLVLQVLLLLSTMLWM